MSRSKTPTKEPIKIPEGVRRESGILVCNVCKFSIPYQGYTDSALDDRPTHRCIERTIRPFDKFDTRVIPVKVRQW
jgi:hypothetical protein